MHRSLDGGVDSEEDDSDGPTYRAYVSGEDDSRDSGMGGVSSMGLSETATDGECSEGQDRAGESPPRARGAFSEVEVDSAAIEEVHRLSGADGDTGVATTESTMDTMGPVSIMATLDGSFGGQLIEPAVDTGACVTMISRNRWWHAGCSKVIEGEKMPALHNASGEPLLVCGKTNVTLKIDSHVYRVPAYIVGKLGVDMLLGADFCRATEAVLDFGDMTVSLNRNRPIELYSAVNGI